MSNVLSNMGLSSSEPFHISLSNIIEKVRCYSACFGGKIIVEDHCEFEESNDKERQEYSDEDFDIIKPNSSTMSPTAPKKNSLDFLSDYYFDTKSPVAFTSPLALY